MTAKETEWPEVGDFVIATIERITDYGAYVFLDEYNKEGLLHISEVARGWIRNVRHFVREGQRVVLQVLRVDAEKGHVDLTLRRVTRRDRREKILSWRQDKKADSLLRSISEKLKIPHEEVYEKSGALIEKEFGGLYEGLKKVAQEGAEILIEIGVPRNMAEAISEIAKEKIRIPMVRVKGTLKLQCTKPKGVTLIQETLLSAQETGKSLGAQVRAYVVSPPRYRIEVSAEQYKEAERVLQRSAETALKAITKVGGQGTFERQR